MPAVGSGALLERNDSLIMQIFSYVLTDFAHHSKPIEAALESLEEALRYGTALARHMLEATPDLTGKGICVTVLNSLGETVSILPFDCLN
ncbi:hypothetical protein [Nitrobacter sp. TKz-YC02]|uniref:hypothetical protein n=1 Tax=Nitrobacter sp. TKz-YC02 TaxID=3398704 RepID=UPI003CF36B37